ncbi:GNAT family N-acetyltransferase [Thalassiella azotivora]
MRDAVPDDVAGVCRFGREHVPRHYAPLIGADAAREQVTRWWSEPVVAAAVEAGLVVVAEDAGRVVGVGQRGRAGEDHVVYKLYVAPGYRSAGLGPRLVDALVRRLPDGVDRIGVEHVAANTRAAAFYEREGFTVDRVDPSPSGDPARATVWRSRPVGTTRP